MLKQKQKKKPVTYDLSQFGADSASEMASLYESTLRTFAAGSIVTGKVIEVRNSEVLVDIGYKSEGLIDAAEFKHIEDVKPGDAFDVLLDQIEDDNGMVVLSREKAVQQLRWEAVLQNCGEGAVVRGIIRSRVKGGLIVDVDGVDAFLPGSQVDAVPVHNTDSLMGNEYDFKVLKINEDRRNIIVSRRELLEEKIREQKRELLATIEKGQVRKGMVKNITDFGVFVDLGGLDGLLHITDMSWGRIRHPSEMVRPGEEVEVLILDVDLDKERVSLGLKQQTPNPWDQIEDKYPVGSRLRGKVVNLAPYGAFVEVEEGVEGLVHVSEISWTKRIARASDVLAVGDEVDVVVLNINKDDQKIALGIRQTEANPWDTVQARYPVGTRITGKVRNFTSYGAFVELEDGIDGMVHVSDMSWTRKVNHPSEVLEKGEEVSAVVLEVDADSKRISLGIKQVGDDPWTAMAAKLRVGDVVTGKVAKIASFGAFIELDDGIDGLVHISQISDGHVEKVQDALKVGDDVTARIVKIDAPARRIGLSMKAADMPEDEFARQYEDLSMEGLRPGEHMVDLAGAFDEAFGSMGEEWHPGERRRKK